MVFAAMTPFSESFSLLSGFQSMVKLPDSLAVGAVLLDDMEDLFCTVQRSLFAGQPVVGGKGIDSKALIVGVLGGVQRLAGVVATPVHTAVFHVIAMLGEKLVGVAGILGKVCPAGQHGSLGEEPQNAAVQDAAFFGLFVQLQVKIHVAVKAPFSSSRQPFPEGNDGLQQHFFCCLFDLWHGKIPLPVLPKRARPG